jgi:pimeloyl-[acyl-carrier protein] synthase
VERAVSATPGIPASFEPVDWSPQGLPDDPDEILAAIYDPAQRGELYPLYHQLRRKGAVHRNRSDVLHGGWAVSRFAEADALFRNPKVVNDPTVIDEAFSNGDGGFTNVMRNVMGWLEPDAHARIRNLVRVAFTPRAIARWRPIAERVTNTLCDRVENDGKMELVEAYNYELPFNVIAHILGISEQDFPLLKQNSWDFARAGERIVSDEVARRGDDAARALTAFFEELVESRRCAPGEDLFSALVAAEEHGDQLSDIELVANGILLLQAGHETTQDLLGNAQVALFRNPDQLELLRQHPELTANAVEEFLRYDGSVQVNHRVLLEDTTVGDASIPSGALIYIFLGAVNRDPARFADPDRLDITRNIPHHLAFSFGAHYCLGASLARIEAAVGIRTLLDRFPGLRPARDGFEWRDTLLLRGPKSIEVAW